MVFSYLANAIAKHAKLISDLPSRGLSGLSNQFPIILFNDCPVVSSELIMSCNVTLSNN
jgi:hypothetical protein